MIKFEIVLGVVHPSSAKNSSSFIQVDCFHLCFYNRDMTKDAAEGIDNVAWIQISCRNLVQQWCEQSEVLVADQYHFYVSMTGDGFVQVFCRVKAGEGSTPAITIRFLILLPNLHCCCSLRSFEIVQLFLLVGVEKLVDFRLHAGISHDQFGQHICFLISRTFDLLFIYVLTADCK